MADVSDKESATKESTDQVGSEDDLAAGSSIILEYDKTRVNQLASRIYKNIGADQETSPRYTVTGKEGRIWTGTYKIQVSCDRRKLKWGPYGDSEFACLIVFDFTFKVVNSRARYREANIRITFQDGQDAGAVDEEAPPSDEEIAHLPRILRYEPINFRPKNKESREQPVQMHAEASLQAQIAPVSLSAGVAREIPSIKVGFHELHGTVEADPYWTLEMLVKENQLVSNEGIYPRFSIPIVVSYIPGRRFIARVEAEVDLEWTVINPAFGKADAPVNFDPDVLKPATEVKLDDVPLQDLTGLKTWHDGVFYPA